MLALTVELLREAAARLAREGRLAAPDRRRKRGWTLQPGPDTPAWNELVRRVAPYLRKRGDKVRLARLLGLSRQRLHQLLVARTACADAERTLLLVGWLQAKSSGSDWV